VTTRGLEVVSLDVYVSAIDNWPNNWAASGLVPNGRARFRTSPKSTNRDDGRENIACQVHAYTVSERKLYEHGYCEVV
jgi:hypothetical protein